MQAEHRRARWWTGKTVLAALALAALAVALAWMAPRQAAAQERGLTVSSVQGVLREAVGQPFSTFLIDDAGRTFGLFGETRAVDQEILRLRGLGGRVQVDGTLFPGGLVSTLDEIAVTRIVAVGAPPPPPTPLPPTRPTVVVNGPTVNVRSGPGTAWPVLGQVTEGTVCTPTGRNGDLTWLLSNCPTVSGWIAASLLVVRGDITGLPVVNAPPPPVPPTPTPPPNQFPNWKASYFNNPTLSGSPIVVRNEPVINFEWGLLSPDTRIPADNFSGRFEAGFSRRTPSVHTISLTIDDGARLWINNELIFDDWRIGSRRTLQTQRWLPDSYRVRIEYFEATENATLVYSIARVDGPAQPTPPPTPQPQGVPEVPPGDGNWGFAYWSNINLQGLPMASGYMARQGSGIDMNWGLGSPAAGVPADNWSARFRGRFFFQAGDHVFTTTADDGVRLRIDGIPVIDAWRDGLETTSNTFYRIGEGNHLIEVDFYERGGVAQLSVGWYRQTGGGSGGGGGGSGGGTSGGGPSRDE